MNIKLDADTAKFWLDDLKLDRIINAVGKPLKHDREELRNGLLLCYHLYGIGSDPGRLGFVKAQSNRLDSIQKHARRLVKLLKSDEDDMQLIGAVWALNPEHPAQLLRQLSFLVETIDKMEGLRGITERTRAWLEISGSALQELINKYLPPVYEPHFGGKATISRNADGTVSGPYFCFVRQVLIEGEIKCADETIARYWEKPEK